jgi:hypothetical protein
MSGAGFFRMKTLQGRGIVSIAARHNRRAIQAELGASASIDVSRCHLNFTLAGPDSAQSVAALAKARMAEAGVGKLRKNAVMAIELLFSLPLSSTVDARAYFADCLAWAAPHFGGTHNILSADVHMDEAAPHCHVLVLPLVDGRMSGSKLAGDRNRLLNLHADFHLTVASRYGFSKAPKRLLGAAKSAAATAVLDFLKTPPDPVLRSKAWPVIRECITSDPAPFALALGIDLPSPKKELRTMTQIFISKGRGGAVEKPIGVSARKADGSLSGAGARARNGAAPPAEVAAFLCSVGVPSEPVPIERQPVEVTRERESEMDAACFDPVTGEFTRPNGPSKGRLKAAAVEWVKLTLEERKRSEAANDATGSRTRRTANG